MPSIDFEKMRSKGTDFLSGFTTGQKIVSVFAIFAVVLGAFYFTQWSSNEDYAVLFSNLAAADAAAVTEDLTSQGVPYRLEDGGSTVLVPRNSVYQARIDLSAKNLPQGGSEGFSLLDKQGITTSDFRQRVDYQRAIQGELEKTISSMTDVASASVMITVPESDVFTSDDEQATASVMIVERPGKTLTSGQVQAIVHLVAGSVMGLSPDNVTVTNARGTLLSNNDGIAAVEDNVAKQAAFEQQAAADLQSLLVNVAGVGNAVVQVNSTLNFDQRESTSEQYQLANPAPGATTPPPLESTEKTETFTGPGNNATGGVLGVDGTVTGGTTGGSDVNYNNTENAEKMPYGKITETVVDAPGQIERMSVAVLVDSDAVAQGDVAQIEALVAAAAGINPARGDAIEITRLPFDRSAQEAAEKEAAAAAASEQRNTMMSMLQGIAAILLVAIVLFIAWRVMKKSARRAAEPIRVPLDVRGLDSGAMTATGPSEIESAYDPYELPPIDATLDEPENSLTRINEELTDLIDRQPEEVAMTLRGWLADRRN